MMWLYLLAPTHGVIKSHLTRISLSFLWFVQRLSLPVDERDVALHSEFRSELMSVLDCTSIRVPQLFICGHHIGGADVVQRLVDDKLFKELVEDIEPIQGRPIVCGGCGGARFILCIECSGSNKIVYDAGGREECPHCNENGLTRCPMC